MMNDLISRQDAIDQIECLMDDKTKVHYNHGCADATATLKNLPPAQRWIPVSERLPEEDKSVLVTVYFMGLKQMHPNGWNEHIKPRYYVDIASHIDGEWSSALDEYKVAWNRHKVVAWQPLPEPYEGGNA